MWWKCATVPVGPKTRSHNGGMTEECKKRIETNGNNGGWSYIGYKELCVKKAKKWEKEKRRA